MSEVANTEKLIKLVRERSLLYDLSHVDYKNRNKKAEAWLEIAAAMGFGESKIWTAKWKSLKDNYNKFKKNNESPTDQTYKKYRSWPWASKMRFLDDHNAGSATESNSHLLESQTFNKTDSQPDTVNQDSLVEKSLITTQEIPENAAGSQIRRKRMKTSASAESSDKILEKLKQKNEQKSTLDGVDYLFLSYAQTFKTFPPRMQSMLKLEMATLFARYELQVEGASDARPQSAQDNSNQSEYGFTSSTSNLVVNSNDQRSLERGTQAEL